MMAKTRSDRSGGSAAVISSSTSSCGSKASARARSSMRRKGRGMSRTCSSRSSPSRSISASSWRTLADLDPGELEVLLDGEVADHRRVLVDRRQALVAGVGGGAERHLLAVDGDGAGVVVQDAGQDLDQGRLAGAVGPEERVHLAGGDRQVDPTQGDHRPERLGHRGRLEERGWHRAPCAVDRLWCGRFHPAPQPVKNGSDGQGPVTRRGPCRRTAGRWCRSCTASPRRPS